MFWAWGKYTMGKISNLRAGFLGILVLGVLARPVYAGLDRGPWLQNVTDSSVDLLYEGDTKDSNGLVEYGPTTSYGNTMATAKRWPGDEFYVAHLAGLKPSSLYHYRLSHEGKVRVGRFSTASKSGEAFTFVVMGDTRSGHWAHQQVVEAIIAEGYPELLFHTGDLVADGGSKLDWRTFFFLEAALLQNTVFCPVFGNHEDPRLFGRVWYGKYFLSGKAEEFWYAFSYGNAQFIILNTEECLLGAQGRFLNSQLSKARSDPDIDFIFVFFHRPGVTTGKYHRPDGSVQRFLMNKFEEYNVDAVFAGHSHCYEHGIVNGIHYFVSGGGGAPLRGLIDPYSPEGWTIQYREAAYHYCTIHVDNSRYSVECKYPDGLVFDLYTATPADGGFPGPTPPDLQDRATEAGCKIKEP